MKKKNNLHYGQLISVYITYSLSEAVLIHARLNDEGIPALIQQESASSALPLSVGPLGEIHVTVKTEDADRARNEIYLISNQTEDDDGEGDDTQSENEIIL